MLFLARVMLSLLIYDFILHVAIVKCAVLIAVSAPTNLHMNYYYYNHYCLCCYFIIIPCGGSLDLQSVSGGR